MTRQAKTPRQRAEEALAVAERKVARLEDQRNKHAAELEALEHELGEAKVRRDYLAQDPALRNTQPRTTPSTGPTSNQETA